MTIQGKPFRKTTDNKLSMPGYDKVTMSYFYCDKPDKFMPFSIYQIPLYKEYVQAEFHPIDHALFLLYSNGQLESVALSGERIGLFSCRHKPLAFRITPDGSLAYILCEGILITYNIISKRHTESKIDDTLNFLECYKDCAVLYGLQKQIWIMKPHGRKLNSFTVDEYIRQVKVISKIQNLLIYNENHHMIFTDMDGKTLWFVEKLYISSEILVSQDGRNGYFFDYSNKLIKFNIQNQSFVELGNIPACKFIAIPADGSLLLLFDLQNNIRLFDENEVNIWNYHFNHLIHQIKMTPRGEYFATIDEDGILTCFSMHSPEKQPTDFLEIANSPRVLDRLTAWSVHSDVSLKLMEVNGARRHAGVINHKGSIDFMDEQGSIHYQITFPDRIKSLSFDDCLTWSFVSGYKQARLIDLTDNRSAYFTFDPFGIHGVIANYDRQKIFMLSKNARLLIYDFKGELINDLPSLKTPADLLSCEKDGIAFFHKNFLNLISSEGESLFTYPFKLDIRQLFYADHQLIGSLSDGSLFSFDLETLKGRFCRFKESYGHAPIVSLKPLLYTDDNGALLHLNLNLEMIITFQIKSASSLFFIENANLLEIIKTRDGFFGHDKNQKLSWRYHSEEPIVGSALMEGGLIFITSNSIEYIRLSDTPQTESRFSKYLEI